ncbi:MAG: ankyrin repeat domain-containing protein [Thermodesulfobacteriota bacterium]|nr:ankyrin repeat domain-containing protein [Thermodesulfobacteriota bacterium]
MKLIFRVCTIIFIVFIMAGVTYADKDRKGSSDYPLISRMPDFWIAAYKDTEYDSHTFRDSANNKITIEGHKYFIEYRLKKGGREPGRLMILKNYENALKEIDAEIFKRTKKDVYSKVTKEGKEIWIQVHALDRLYRLTIVEREQMEQKLADDPDASSADTATTAADIHEAAKKGSLEKVKAFLANGEKVDVKNKHGLTPLYLAAAEGHKNVCEYLIAQGADVNAGREIGFVPLSGALNNRTERGVEIFKILVDHGADYNINIGGYPLLHQAVYSCHNESVRRIAEFLIAKGVDVNAKGYQDKTPLHMVGCKEICELLILKGADIEARDKYGQTPIFEACSATRKKEVCEFFISKGADIEARDKNGRTPLWKACSSNELKVCEFLISKGADIEAGDKDGRTPLWKACSNANMAISKLLISKDADIEARDKDGQTPLWQACSNSNMAISKLLISKGADVNAKDNRGWTPLRQVHSECLTTRNTEICDLLKKHGGVK